MRVQGTIHGAVILVDEGCWLPGGTGEYHHEGCRLHGGAGE